MSLKPYFITTAIAYTSKKPHIGNTYEVILTDAIARFKRMQGYDVFFLTGTDEHGQKIEELARQFNTTPKEYVDKIAGEIRETCDLMNVSYDHFIRTTDEYHEKTVQKIIKKLYDQGDIYKDLYEGLYCTPCEAFFTETQLNDGKCPDCGRDVQKTKEEAYFFRFSKYQKQLEEHIENNPNFILPESKKREMVNNFIKPGIQDLCISRSSFKWGVPVSFDEKHVVYVWIDALLNYITALDYDPDVKSAKFQKYWPANAHIIGKDILRFHTIYWPIMLIALGEELPKTVFGHPWFLFGNDKMSKSKGNVIFADEMVEIFGVDAVRYYLLREMPYSSDGSITYEAMIERYNSDLANTLGNLVNRTISMIQKYFGGEIKAPVCEEDIDNELKEKCLSTVNKVSANVEDYKIADALEAIMSLARRSNKYIDETTPWILARDEDNKQRLQTVLYNLAESIRFIAVLLEPFMPQASFDIMFQLNSVDTELKYLTEYGVIAPNTKVHEAVPLFVRIDAEKLLAEINAKSVIVEKVEAPKEEIKLADEITIDDFFKVELRVALVTSCEPVPKAKKLLCLQLDDGMGGRQVVSGIAEWYKPEDLVGKKVIVVANLKPVTLRGFESNGMICAADMPDGSAKVIFPDQDIPVGSKVR